MDGPQDQRGGVRKLRLGCHTGIIPYVGCYLTAPSVVCYIGVTAMLELRNLTKRFLGIAAVDSVSFTARAGEITGYLGPNASGKSTTMKMITGLMEATSGEILLNGERIQKD